MVKAFTSIPNEDKNKNNNESTLRKFLEENNFAQSEIFSLDKELYSDEADYSTARTEAYFSQVFLNKLKEKGIIQDYEVGEEFSKVNMQQLIALASKSFPISVDVETKRVVVKDVEGDVSLFIEDNFSEGIRRSLTDILPDVNLDVIQAGDKERAVEVESIYKTVILNKIYDNIFQDEIGRILQQYDFKLLSQNAFNFTSLIRTISENSSPTIRIILSACNIKLAEAKTKKESRIYMSLSKEESQELQDLNIRISVLRMESEQEIETFSSQGEKILRREKFEKEKERMIENSPVRDIYRILKVNVEDASDIARQKIAMLARQLAYDIKMKESLEGRESLVRKIETRLRKRGLREYLVEVRERLLAKYRKDGIVNLKTF